MAIYDEVFNEYLEKISAAKIPGFSSVLKPFGKALLNPSGVMKTMKGVVPAKTLGKDFMWNSLKKYPAQFGATALGGVAANRAAGNMAYGERRPGEMSRGALGMGGIL
jgi:hypothetical protein